MIYVDGSAAAVPVANKQAYLDMAASNAAILRKYGATRITQSWEEDVPEGNVTSFPMAVKRQAGEAIIFSWIEWPSQDAREAGWKLAMADPNLRMIDMPFDGTRVIFGGFNMILDA